MSSEIVNYLDDELTTLYLSATNPKVLKKQHFRLRESNIPAINKQIQQFQTQAFDAVEQEVYEEIMNETDFDSLNATGRVVDYGRVMLEFKRPNLHVTIIDADKFDTFVASKITNADLKQHLNDVYSSVRDFEYNVVKYKQQLKEFLISKLPMLAHKYEVLKRSNTVSFMATRTKRIGVPKTLKLFIKQALEAALNI